MVEAKTQYEYQLLKAVKKGKIRRVQKLLNNDGIRELENARYFDYYLTAKALRESKVAIAKLFIEKGFRVYKKSESEDTILHYAVKSADIDLITSLVAKGASDDILTPNKGNRTPLHLAIYQPSIVELFLAQLDIRTFDVKCFINYAIPRRTIPVASQVIGNSFSLTKEAKKYENFKTLDILQSYCSVKNMKSNNYDEVAPVYIASICGNLKIIQKYADSGLPINISLELTNDSSLYLSDYSEFTLLHFAAKHVKLEVVEFLLSVRADIVVQNKTRSSPLHIAFEAKEIGIWKTWQDFDDNNSIIDLILEANTKFNSNPINKHGLSHFHIACSTDEPSVIEHFLKLGASVNHPVKPQCHLYKEFSPLHFVAKFRCKKTVELLLRNGADVKQRDYMKMTALHIAARESCLDVVSLLLQYGADVVSLDSQGNTPLHWAFENQSYKIMDLLLSVPNVPDSNPINSKGVSHFHIACTRNNIDVVKIFIKNGVLLDTCIPAQPVKEKIYTFKEKFDPYIPDWSGYSPLHLAVCHNKAAIVQLLLDEGANVQIKNNKGYNPLHITCCYPYEMFAEFIENSLSDLSKHGKISQKLRSFTDIAKVYEKHANFSGSIEKIDWSSNRIEHEKIIKSLLNKGSDVDSIDSGNATPIFWAYWLIDIAVQDIQSIFEKNLGCSEPLLALIIESLIEEIYKRRKALINNLLERDANLNKCSKYGSILNCVCFGQDKDSDEMMKLFLEKGANVNAKDNNMLTPLYHAVKEQSKSLISILMDYNADVDCVDPQDRSTPLLITSKSPKLLSSGIIDLLIDKGANVNARQSNGQTAFHNLALLCLNKIPARSSGQKICRLKILASVVPILVKAGADINSRDSNGFTALHLACLDENIRFVSVFLEHGADINVEDNDGRSVCCYVYDVYRSSLDLYRSTDRIVKLVTSLQTHVIKMNVIGLPVSEKTSSSILKCNDMIFFALKLTDRKKKALISKYQAEVDVLRDTQIHSNCTLYDAIFKNENALSQLVKNPGFEAIVQSESFEEKYRNYGYLIRLKYQAGVDRGNLLPVANCVLNNLAGLYLPDTCSENIGKYFTNAELRETTEMLSSYFNVKTETSDDISLRDHATIKRQKVN